jgi:hypothetical protein
MMKIKNEELLIEDIDFQDCLYFLFPWSQRKVI